MSKDSIDDLVARVDDLVVPGTRVQNTLNVAEATDLTYVAGEEGTQFSRALAWGNVRSALADILRVETVRIGAIEVPAPLPPDEAVSYAEVLARAVAAEVLPARGSKEEAPERFGRYAELVGRLTEVFTARFGGVCQ